MVNSELTQRPWLTKRVPNGFWDLRVNRVRYMDWLGDQSGFRDAEDWYAVRKRHFKKNFGGGLLATKYSDSAYEALRDYRPNFHWIPWKFHTAPRNFWADGENRRAYMRWLEAALKIESPAGWYAVTKSTFRDHHGAGLLKCAFNDSVLGAVTEYLPDHEWIPWMFRETPQRYWHSAQNRRRYMTWLGERLGFTSPADWRSVSKATFQNNFGGGLLSCAYNDSPQQALLEFVPEVCTQPWLLNSVGQGHWHESQNRFDYLRWLGGTLEFQTPADWLRLKAAHLRRHHGAGLLRFYSMHRLNERQPHPAGKPTSDRRSALWPRLRQIERALTHQDPEVRIFNPA